MGNKTGITGLGSNFPEPDAGTLAVREHGAKVPAGQAEFDHAQMLAQAEPVKQVVDGEDVLAAFDLRNAVIWLSEDSLNKMRRAFDTGKVLKAEDVQTLAHEFAHVVQSKVIFERYTERADRARALVKEDIERISKMAENDYINFRMGREQQAEEVGLVVFAELKKSRELLGFAKGDADTWAHNARFDYVEGKQGFRAHYKEVRGKLDNAPAPAAGAAGTAKGPSAPDPKAAAAAQALGKSDMTAKMKLVGSLRPIFPGEEESRTLAKLLQVMEDYKIVVVVSESFGRAAKK